jgi:hypothetical protein
MPSTPVVDPRGKSGPAGTGYARSTDFQLADAGPATGKNLKDDGRRRRRRAGGFDGRGDERAIGTAKQDVVQEGLLVQELAEEGLAGPSIQAVDGRMA